MAKKKPAASKKKTAKKTRSAGAAGSRKKKPSRKKAASTQVRKSKKKSTTGASRGSAARSAKRAKKSASSAGAGKKRRAATGGAKTARTRKKTAKKTTEKSKSATTRPARRKSGREAAAASSARKEPTKKPAAAPPQNGETPKEEKASFGGGRPALADAKAVALRFAAAAGLRPVEESAEERALAASREGKRLTKSPLRKRELEYFRKLLLQKRNEVLSDVSAMEEEALRSDRGSLSALTQHMADQGSDEYEQSLSLGLAESQRHLLVEIDEALERIEKGTYGVCSILGSAIPKERLEAKPWAKTSLEGARLLDRGLVRDSD